MELLGSIKDFLFEHLNITSILAVALIFVTALYVRETRRIARIMERDLEIRIRPLIDVKKGSATSSNLEYVTSIDFKNVGDFTGHIRRVYVRLHMPDEADKECDIKIDNEEFALIPQSSSIKKSIKINRDDCAKLGINMGKRHIFGVHIKADLHYELSGPDRKFEEIIFKVF